MWAYNYNDELYHYGVKGMKWGLIREQKKASRETRESELTPEQRKKKSQFKEGCYYRFVGRWGCLGHIWRV